MAAALLGERLRGVPELVPVESAGLLAEGFAADKSACQAMAGLGHDITTHASRRLTAEAVAAAELVVGMERLHVREAVVMAPEAFPRCFTLRELVRRGRAVGPRRPDQPVRHWLAQLAEGRTHADLLGESAIDDIDDPMGMPASVFRSLAAELDELTAAFAALVAGG